MKKTFYLLLPLLGGGLLVGSCRQTSGSVPPENVTEMLQSPRMAVTASLPGWVLEKKSISSLTRKEIRQLREILRAEDVRSVPEKYYRDVEDGNRGDVSDATFYIYGSNAQCLGGRVVKRDGKNTVMMDDFELSEENQDALYEMVLPHLRKINVVK